MVDGRIRAHDLTGAFKSALKRAIRGAKGQPANDENVSKELLRLAANEPALRLRRFWSHTMDDMGLAELEVIMGGHSSAISNSHYKKQIDKILKADVPAI